MKIQIQTKIFTFRTKTKIVMKDLAFFFSFHWVHHFEFRIYSSQVLSNNFKHANFWSTPSTPYFQARKTRKHAKFIEYASTQSKSSTQTTRTRQVREHTKHVNHTSSQARHLADSFRRKHILLSLRRKNCLRDKFWPFLRIWQKLNPHEKSAGIQFAKLNRQK